MSRVDQNQVHLVVEGRDCGIWQTFAGGGLDSEESFTRDGYGLPREPLGGPSAEENWTVSRTFKIDRDPDLYRFLRQQVKRSGEAAASVQVLDPDGFPVGIPEPHSGKCKAIKKDDVNVEGSDAMKITLEVSARG